MPDRIKSPGRWLQRLVAWLMVGIASGPDTGRYYEVGHGNSLPHVSAAEPAIGTKPNRLIGESSPYLLQHARNPVKWQPWDQQAFEQAQSEQKLIFLSIGYSTCHWCHVMERESFTNPAIAELLNRHFVCIKVDREERPDIDQLYLLALQAMGQPGGWPLHMFLTADGKPIVGGTYWPPADRMVDGERIPGLPTVLQAIIDAQTANPELLQQTAQLRADQTRRALSSQRVLLKPVEPTRQHVEAAVAAIVAMADPVHGGFGQAPEFNGAKFPQPGYLRLLQEVRSRTVDSPLQTILDTTLSQMARGGIYDQIGGGFHRYSTERTWTVPHFEKMLYDNGQLLEVYAIEQAARPSPFYATILRETVECLMRDFRTPEGVFITAIDAETNGVEGEYYVWTEEQWEQAFPNQNQRAKFASQFGVEGPPNFLDNAWVLRRPSSAEPLDSATQQQVRNTLRQIRSQRTQPQVDRKVLVAWNGLTIAGLARAGATLKEPDWISAAEQAADTLLKLARKPTGELVHGLTPPGENGSQPQGVGFLDDYTHFIHGLLTLHDITANERWLKAAQQLTAVMIQQFYDADQPAFYYSPAEADPLFLRLKDQYDGVMPSGNSQAVLNLLELAERTRDDRYQALAWSVLRTQAIGWEQAPASMPDLARGLLKATPPNPQSDIAP